MMEGKVHGKMPQNLTCARRPPILHPPNSHKSIANKHSRALLKVTMSLYYEAASVLTDEAGGGSLKSRIYNDIAKFKSRPAQLYALITETAKYDIFLKEVIENADILRLELKVCEVRLLNTRVAAD